MIDCVSVHIIKTEYTNNAPNEKLFNYILFFFVVVVTIYLTQYIMGKGTDVYFIQKKKINSFILFECFSCVNRTFNFT